MNADATPSPVSSHVSRLVSGGQAGVDRAALDFAVNHGLPYGGWVPRGGRTEDGVDLLRTYAHLRQMPTADYPARTRKNVEDSDATLIVCPERLLGSSRGTRLTAHVARELTRPLLIAGPEDATTVQEWVASLSPAFATGLVLNVAGPRASGWPDGYAVTYALLRDALSA